MDLPHHGIAAGSVVLEASRRLTSVHRELEPADTEPADLEPPPIALVDLPWFDSSSID